MTHVCFHFLVAVLVYLAEVKKKYFATAIYTAQHNDVWFVKEKLLPYTFHTGLNIHLGDLCQTQTDN